MLCAITETNELLTPFCYVFKNNTMCCPKFRTVKKKFYYGLSFEKYFFCLFGTLIKWKPVYTRFVLSTIHP